MRIQNRPNVVFVLTDDQGYGDLACLGNPIIQTPNLDHLHAESIRLQDYHVGPTCAPTRAGLLTGHYHNSTGVWHTIGGRSLLRSDEWTLASAFAENGYATGLFGKWHLGDNFPYRPQDRGFQEVVTHGGGGIGNTPDYWGNNYNDDSYAVNGVWTPFSGYCTDVWFGEAINFIERHKDEPFFCLVTPNAPHSPYIVAESYSQPYLGQVDTPERADFYGMITSIDENLGLLRHKLAEWGLDQNTIFIFMSDNGSSGGASLDQDGFVVEGFNGGMRGLKGSEYEGGHRVPLFIHWPKGGLNKGRDIAELAANIDIMPTLLDLCGLEPNDQGFDGASLRPLLYAEDSNWPDRIIVTDSQRLAYPEKWRKSATMMSRGNHSWRLINGQELYDVQTDPEQRFDIATSHPDIVTHLRAGYEAWWAKVSQQFDHTIPITIGLNIGESVLLNSHDWRNDPVQCAWNQSLIRSGLECNGYWEIEVSVTGRYAFELRRWPREEDRPITQGIAGPPKSYDKAITSGYGGGRAIPLLQAQLSVGEVTLSHPIASADKHVTLVLNLEAGETRIQTSFSDSAGTVIGAYYVYVERLR